MESVENQPSFTAKKYISSMPSQKTGVAAKTMARAVGIVSRAVYCLTAVSTPSGTPISAAIARAMNVVRKEIGIRFCSSDHTVVL